MPTYKTLAVHPAPSMSRRRLDLGLLSRPMKHRCSLHKLPYSMPTQAGTVGARNVVAETINPFGRVCCSRPEWPQVSSQTRQPCCALGRCVHCATSASANYCAATAVSACCTALLCRHRACELANLPRHSRANSLHHTSLPADSTLIRTYQMPCFLHTYTSALLS